MSMEKSHWRLQPLYWPNQSSGKTRTDHYIQVANWTLWPASTPETNWHHGLCDCKEAEQTIHHIRQDCPIWRKQRHSYGRRMSQQPTSCGERRKTCAAPPKSWQHVDWGSKHGWSTAEEEEVGLGEGPPINAHSRRRKCRTTWCLSAALRTSPSLHDGTVEWVRQLIAKLHSGD